MDQNHGGEEEGRDDVHDDVMHMANHVISCYLGLAEDGDWLDR